MTSYLVPYKTYPVSQPSVSFRPLTNTSKTSISYYYWLVMHSTRQYRSSRAFVIHVKLDFSSTFSTTTSVRVDASRRDRISCGHKLGDRLTYQVANAARWCLTMQCQPQRTQGHKRQDFNKTKRGGEWKETRNRTARQKRKKTQNTKHSPTDTHHYRQLLATHGIWRYPTYIRGSIHNGFRNILLAGALPYGV